MPPLQVWVACDNSSLSAEINFTYVEKSEDVPAKEFWVQYNMDENEPNYWETYPIPVSHLSNVVYGNIRPSLHPYRNFTFRVVARNDVSGILKWIFAAGLEIDGALIFLCR